MLHQKVQQTSARRSGRNVQCESHANTRLRSVLKLVETGGFLRRKYPRVKKESTASTRREFAVVVSIKLSVPNGEYDTNFTESGAA